MSTPDLILLHAPSVYDFRQESILYGPVSDLVPSTPVFEMYPIGFTTIAEYLERHGLRVRIVNLAVRMLKDARFDAEAHLARLDAVAFGIDLHWLPHAHGALQVACALKRLHPQRPVILGGFSSTYFHAELMRRPQVDFVVRGDSTEVPMLQLVTYLRSGGAAHPPSTSAQARQLARIPNLVWRDGEGEVHVNPLTYSPDTLDDLLLDYSYVIKAVARYRDLASFVPFKTWLRYPIMAALSVRGCRFNCVTCGGSACAYATLHGRQRPAYRKPADLANDIRRVGQFSHGPIFVLGDIRQAGDEYADQFLEAIAGYRGALILELFDAAPPSFFRKLARAVTNFTIEISLESHDDRVRRAFGRPYTTQAIEESMAAALDAGCQRLDLFFMTGLGEQTVQSVMDTVRYCRTLEEHRQALLAPTWKYVLNYETRWMTRDQIVAATYEAGRQMNRLKARYGLIEPSVAEATEQRIARAVALSAEIDRIMASSDAVERQARLRALKPQVDDANLSTVCDKRELELPVTGAPINLLHAVRIAMQEWWKGGRALAG